MSEADKTAIAAHIYIMFRRTANRVIDVEWMAKNDEYAKEVIRMARQLGSDELTHYAGLYEELAFGIPAPVPLAKPPLKERAIPPTHETAEDGNPDEGEDIGYIGHLR